jgi:hypothetical protein
MQTNALAKPSFRLKIRHASQVILLAPVDAHCSSSLRQS